MLRVVAFGPDAEENHRIRDLLDDILRAAETKLVFKEFTGERAPFFTYVKNNPYLVMLIVQSGPEAEETVRLAKEANPKARLIWFSEQDDALLAFELRLTFFGLLPVSQQKAESALKACWYEMPFPPNIRILAQSTPYSQQ